MATDLTARLDEETKKAPAFQATPIQRAITPAIPTLGSGLQGMSRVIADSIVAPNVSVSPPEISGRDGSGTITADSAVAATGKDMQRPGGVFGGIDMAGANAIMARENKARGEMVDLSIKANGGSGAAILGADANGFTQTDRDNAEKTARWRQDDLLAKAKYNPAAAGVAASIVNGDSHLAAEGVRANANYAAEIARQGITARGQDLNAMTDLNRNQVVMRGQDINSATDAQRLGIERSRLDMAGNDQARAAEKWGVERSILQGQAQDSEAVRLARSELTAAINSGDPSKIEAAKAKAIAAGVKFDKPANEFTAVTNQTGGTTILNKDTGSGSIYNVQGKKVADIVAPGTKPAAPSFEQYSAQIRAKNPGITDDQIKAGYSQMTGAR